MLQARVGVPSAIQDSTFHQNRENANRIELEYSEVNFNKLVFEVVRLREQRILDQDKILKKNEELLVHKSQIMELCKKYEVDTPLMIIYRGAN
jgi:hypothetical protein